MDQLLLLAPLYLLGVLLLLRTLRSVLSRAIRIRMAERVRRVMWSSSLRDHGLQDHENLERAIVYIFSKGSWSLVFLLSFNSHGRIVSQFVRHSREASWEIGVFLS